MDIELLKTFLEVHRTRHFGRAAANLFLTQSAISARIRQLESDLGVRIFDRSRNGIDVTPAGARLLKHAELIVNAWRRARQDTALADDRKIPLAIGGMYSLWEALLQDWLIRLHRRLPDIAFQAEPLGGEVLVRRLLDGVLDLGFMFEPPQIAELHVEEVAAVRLLMVTSEAALSADAAVGQGYVMVDWGTSFSISHARYFPDMPNPLIRAGQGSIALAFILGCGGGAYLAERMVQPLLDKGRLHRVDDAPVIDRWAYAVYPVQGPRNDVVKRALALFKEQPSLGPRVSSEVVV